MKTKRKPAARTTLTDDAILAKLESLHAEAWREAAKALEESANEIGGDVEKSNPLFCAAESICASLIAFPARSWPSFKAKARILRREYPEMSASEILHETERGARDVVASILDDLLALA